MKNVDTKIRNRMIRCLDHAERILMRHLGTKDRKSINRNDVKDIAIAMFNAGYGDTRYLDG